MNTATKEERAALRLNARALAKVLAHVRGGLIKEATTLGDLLACYEACACEATELALREFYLFSGDIPANGASSPGQTYCQLKKWVEEGDL